MDLAPRPSHGLRLAIVALCAALAACGDGSDWTALNERAKEAHRPAREAGSNQALFGIIQGGTDPALRQESVVRTVEIGFDGYGIGGLSVGEAREEMLGSTTSTTSCCSSCSSSSCSSTSCAGG